MLVAGIALGMSMTVARTSEQATLDRYWIASRTWPATTFEPHRPQLTLRAARVEPTLEPLRRRTPPAPPVPSRPSAPGGERDTPVGAPRAPGIGRRLLARLIDDGVVAALAVGLAMAVNTVIEDRMDVYYPPGSGELLGMLADWDYLYRSTAHMPTVAGVVTLLLILTGTFAYYVGASAARGRTPGRALAGLAVVQKDGTPAGASVLLGRELLRIGLLGSAVAVLRPIGNVLTATINGLSAEGPTPDLLINATNFVAIPLVAAIWIGATLVDPRHRSPHDLLARTLVVDARHATPSGAA